ncbi:MAG: hypothetical protein ABUL77_03120 [Bacteroidota bacterium]
MLTACAAATHASEARLIQVPEAVLAPRETALVRPARWAYSIGVFNPLTLAIMPRLEIQTHPLVFLVAPNIIVRVAHVPLADRWGLTGEYGFSVPTLAMRLAQGHLFPSWENGQGQVGWALVPRAGLVFSHFGAALPGQTAVVTARVDLAVGVRLSTTDAQPLDAPAPIDLLFEPVLNRYRGRVGLLWDSSLGRRWRVRAYGDLYVHGVDSAFRAPRGAANLTTRLGAGVDIGLGEKRRTRFTFGVAWWNAEQHAIDPVTWQARRSNDIWPTLDFIWETPGA